MFLIVNWLSEISLGPHYDCIASLPPVQCVPDSYLLATHRHLTITHSAIYYYHHLGEPPHPHATHHSITVFYTQVGEEPRWGMAMRDQMGLITTLFSSSTLYGRRTHHPIGALRCCRRAVARLLLRGVPSGKQRWVTTTCHSARGRRPSRHVALSPAQTRGAGCRHPVAQGEGG